MRFYLFAEEYSDFEFVQEVLAQITWYHNIILMDKINDIEERKWYINEIVKNGWSSKFNINAFLIHMDFQSLPNLLKGFDTIKNLYN